jgi:hypothetical protein
MAQNQFRFGLSPPPRMVVMRQQAFGFGSGKIYCVS